MLCNDGRMYGEDCPLNYKKNLRGDSFATLTLEMKNQHVSKQLKDASKANEGDSLSSRQRTDKHTSLRETPKAKRSTNALDATREASTKKSLIDAWVTHGCEVAR